MLLLTVVGLTLTASQPPAPHLPRTLDLSGLRALPVQHDGRWPPLDTLARDVVETVTGEAFFQGRDPLLLLLAWTFDPDTWRQQPLVRIASPGLRRELRLPAERSAFSLAELTGHRPLLELIDGLQRIDPERKLNPLEAKVSDINKKLVTLQQVFSGRTIRLLPHAESVGGAWRPILPPALGAAHAPAAVTDAWDALRRAFLADDDAAFAGATQNLTDALAGLPAAHRPSDSAIAVELRYNRLRPFHIAWLLLAGGGALYAAAPLVRRSWGALLAGAAVTAAGALLTGNWGFNFLRKLGAGAYLLLLLLAFCQSRWPRGAAVIALLPGFATLSYGLLLRWQIAGRIPAANMFESLLFLSWGAVAFGIVSALALRKRIVPLTAAGLGALALFLADCLPLDQYVRPIAPVLLDTYWMSIHVPVIMASYSVLALGVLIAHAQLIAAAAAPRRAALIDAIDRLHYWYVSIGALLLAAGIATGSMWAASSWGRYWGWDPKEVWSLIALLGYLTILHVRVDRERVPAWAYAVAALLAAGVFGIILSKLAPLTPLTVAALAGAGLVMLIFVLARGPLATAFKSVLAFWLIIMTYVGVNFVLGIGLHSYGFGTGAVARYMFLLGGIDLALMAACCLIYLARRQPAPVPAQAAALPA